MGSGLHKNTFIAVSSVWLVIASLAVSLISQPHGKHMQPVSSAWMLRFDGIGPVKVGMTMAQMNAALDEKFSMPDSKHDQGCFYLGTNLHPQVAFMMENGRLVRIDVNGSGVSTAEGIQAGDSEKRVRRVYGTTVKVESHAYSPDDHYLTIRSSRGHNGLRFETDKGKVTNFYAGRFKAVQYIEGCL